MRAFLKKLMTLGKDAGGNVLLIAGAGTVALVGGAGLGVDTVEWYLWQRQLQQAVDSGAMAGAQAKAQGTNWRVYGAKEVNRNANTSVSIVRLASKPVSGGYTSDNSAVEVIATTRQTLPFSSIFVDSAPILRARAVATSVADGEHCVISLAPDGVGVNVAGSADVLLGCGVAANSGYYKAMDLGGSSHLSATPLSAVGGINYASDNIDSTATIQAYGVKQADPIAARGLSVPTSPAGCTSNNYKVQPSDVITYPLPASGVARLCNGLDVKGDLTLPAGTYIIDGGLLKVNSGAKLSGQGVTIILTGNNAATVANMEIAGGAVIDLHAPTDIQNPDWAGILIYQDPIAGYPLSKINGGSSFKMEGVVYMPKGDIAFQGNTDGTSKCLLLVSNRVNFTGDAELDNDCPSYLDDIDLSARIIRLVE